MKNKGIEISSYSDGLGYALTNPIFYSPTLKWWQRTWTEEQEMWRVYMIGGIRFDGQYYEDVETAYQKNKHKYATKVDLFNNTQQTTDDLMIELLTIKLSTYPKLIEEIDKMGGAEWILQCTHQPTKQNTHWETGGDNAFIIALYIAYKNVKLQINE